MGVRRLRVLFGARGGSPETAWCRPLGGNRACLLNILFLHETPALGDEIEVAGDPPRFKRVVRKGGRYTMIVDYPRPRDFRTLVRALAPLEIEGEGCYAPRGDEPGRLYLAVPRSLRPRAVLDAARQHVPGAVVVHPRIKAPPPAAAPAPSRARGPTRPKGGARTPLFAAVRDGETALARKLLAAGADPDEGAPLLAAAMRDRPTEARLLIAAGADPSRARDADGDPCVVVAAFRDNLAVLRVLLTSRPPREVLSHALIEAAGNGNLPIVELLLAHGADPLWRSSRGNTALAVARRRRRAEVVRRLSAVTATEAPPSRRRAR